MHETETTAYLMDAIALGQSKAMLAVGSIAIEEPAARAMAQWLAGAVEQRVTYVSSDEGLREVL